MAAVFALRFQNLPARNSSLKIFKHEKEEKLAGPKGKLAGPAQFLVAEGLGLALNAKTVAEVSIVKLPSGDYYCTSLSQHCFR